MADRKRLWLAVRKAWALLGVAALAGFAVWSLVAYRASAAARMALASDGEVEVVRRVDHWSFAPAAGRTRRDVGLLFLPGALVEPAAYAPLARAVAIAGHSVLLVELPRRGAFGGADGGEMAGRARRALQQTSSPARWVVAGHSRGGAVAARLVHEGFPGVAGLVLVGTTHPRDFSLASSAVPVTKILGNKDGVAPLEKSEENRRLLPATARWVVIEGGNHSQFGWYGFQPGDRFATIDRARQQALTQQAILAALAGQS